MDKLWNFQPTDLGLGFGTLDGEDPWVEVNSNWGRLQLCSFFASCTSIWYRQLLTYSSPVSWVFCSVAYDGFAADVGDYKVLEGTWSVESTAREDHTHITEAMDVYSFGMLCYELLTGHTLEFEDLGLSEYVLVLSGNDQSFLTWILTNCLAGARTNQS